MLVPDPNDLNTDREWLETNGIGGFSSSTPAGMNTRRYHGLLTAATKPPVGRMLLLSKLEETIIINGERFDLSTNQFAGVNHFNSIVHPSGYQYLVEFKLDPWPVWTWQAGGARIVKTLFMVRGENCVVVDYTIDHQTQPAESHFEIKPLIAFRDFHATTQANDALNRDVAIAPGLASVAPYYGLPRLYFAHNADQLLQHGYWYYGFEFVREKERGLDFTEDLYNPFTLHFAANRATIIASTNQHGVEEAQELRAREASRRQALTDHTSRQEPLITALTKAADQFIVTRGDFNSVIAGYHWFADWGRDTMVALPGLTLTTARPDIARSVLLEYAAYVDQGMLPNRFPDQGDAPEYNTADATLWFFEAVRSYIKYTGDSDLVRDRLYPVLKDIIEWHIRGTRYGIGLAPDGLIHAGDPLTGGEQLTWMDAKSGDQAITPRSGKPVEIQALWYNALRIVRALAKTFDDQPTRTLTSDLADRAAQSFNEQFWNESTGCLYDVIREGTAPDGSIRPNQIIAASLHYTMLLPARVKRILDVVERELLTPFGLRTLSPRDPRYHPRYEGNAHERDAAYHQGTVWPWLMGPFITAFMKSSGRSAEARARAQGWLEAFLPHLEVAGLGQVSEIFDGDPPHTPRGCIAQAWSVAELLRVALEEVYTG